MYAPVALPALACKFHPQVPAMAYFPPDETSDVPENRVPWPLCGECFDRSGPEVQKDIVIVPLPAQIQMQSLCDMLAELLVEDGAWEEVVFDWEVNGTDHGVGDDMI